MKSNILPISTAMYDPKWFHQNKGHSFRYFDKNGVLNGVRMASMVLNPDIYEKMIELNESCDNCKNIQLNSDELCPFMQKYLEYLYSQHSNFNTFLRICEGYVQFLNSMFSLQLDTIIFIVHEPPSRNCGERPMIQRWFRENGIELREWNKNAQ